MLLEAQKISVAYGTVKALTEVSFNVRRGEIVAMIGPNGAGKSTALKSICGIIGEYGGGITAGQVLFKDLDISDKSTHELVQSGLSLVPEGRRVFASMTVRENLEMGAYTVVRGQGPVIRERMEKVFELFPVLKNRKQQKAGTLSSGEQQMLAIGRALMLKPELLLLDEPSLGLSPNFVEQVFEKLEAINKSGTSILLVEQNAQMALEVCHRGYVFDIGTVALEGTREDLLKDNRVKEVFLGGKTN